MSRLACLNITVSGVTVTGGASPSGSADESSSHSGSSAAATTVTIKVLGSLGMYAHLV